MRACPEVFPESREVRSLNVQSDLAGDCVREGAQRLGHAQPLEGREAVKKLPCRDSAAGAGGAGGGRWSVCQRRNRPQSEWQSEESGVVRAIVRWCATQSPKHTRPLAAHVQMPRSDSFFLTEAGEDDEVRLHPQHHVRVADLHRHVLVLSVEARAMNLGH